MHEGNIAGWLKCKAIAKYKYKLIKCDPCQSTTLNTF